MEFHVGNAQHIGARSQQQDSFAFSDPGDRAAVGHGGFLGVVADGMGGLSDGQRASATAVQTFLQAYRAKSPAEPISDALRRSLLVANRAVIELQDQNPESESGSTFAAAVVTEEHLHWIAAGDSRIYWLKDNQLTRLTADHVYAAKLDREVAMGRLSRAEAQSDPQRGSLTSYLGQPGPTLIDGNLRPIDLHAGESIILCSDGFYRAVSEEEIVAHFNADPQTACDRLVELALSKQRRQQDNLTVIAFRATASQSGMFPPLTPSKVALLAIFPILLAVVAGAYWWHSRLVATPPVAVKPSLSSSQPQVVSPHPVPPAPAGPGAATVVPQAPTGKHPLAIIKKPKASSAASQAAAPAAKEIPAEPATPEGQDKPALPTPPAQDKPSVPAPPSAQEKSAPPATPPAHEASPREATPDSAPPPAAGPPQPHSFTLGRSVIQPAPHPAVATALGTQAGPAAVEG
jgi:PPM family protein phosphatase